MRSATGNDLTLTSDKHPLRDESCMCVGPTADSPLRDNCTQDFHFGR